MKERPILFSAPMVRAILSGQKTQTRRVVKPQPDEDGLSRLVGECFWHDTSASEYFCPYGKPGDRLWVRETWRHTASSLEEARAITEDITSGIAVDWRATYIDVCMKELGFSREDAEISDSFERWRPSIHMPRWASRITLEVTGVRVERLQDISVADAIAEGIHHDDSIPFNGPWFASATCSQGCGEPAHAYANLWESINGPGSWDSNPWVWVVEFKRVAA